jgi:hypothetical protein
VLERYRLEDWRAVLVAVHRTLKANKAFEPARLGGLLVVAVDANEQFHSRHRCCPDCCQRHREIQDAAGRPATVTEYYHRQVDAQIHGPGFSVILDVEPLRPGEDESAAAVRMLGRMRRLYGPRCFDVVTVDAWYATGPFFRAVQKLGWGVVSVLKQERHEVYQEATALSRRQPPHRWHWQEREVDLWEVKDLPFTDAAVGSVRVVLADEHWTEPATSGRPHAARAPAQSLALAGEPRTRRRGSPRHLADRTPTLGRGESRVQRTDPALSPHALPPPRGGGNPGLAADPGTGLQPL